MFSVALLVFPSRFKLFFRLLLFFELLFLNLLVQHPQYKRLLCVKHKPL